MGAMLVGRQGLLAKTAHALRSEQNQCVFVVREGYEAGVGEISELMEL